MADNYWLMKSEPFKYSWDDLEKDGETVWDGVRNHLAAQNLRAMAVGDQAFYYHSNKGLEIVGIAEISEAGLIDPTDTEGKWPTVKIVPKTKLPAPVTLKAIKQSGEFADMELIRLSRLSVSQVTRDEWSRVLAMAGI